MLDSNDRNAVSSPQLTALLGDAPALLADCLRSSFQPGDMKAVLEHHSQLGHFKEKGREAFSSS